jgi:hypothetical protein
MLIRVIFLTSTAMDCLSCNKVTLLWSITNCHSSFFSTAPVGSKQSAYLSCCFWRQRRICVARREYDKGTLYMSVKTVSSLFSVPICVTTLRPISQVSMFTPLFLFLQKRGSLLQSVRLLCLFRWRQTAITRLTNRWTLLVQHKL